MRYVCKIYGDGTVYAYESTDDAWKVKKVFEGHKPKHLHAAITFAEIISDDNEAGRSRLKQALRKLQEIVNQEVND